LDKFRIADFVQGKVAIQWGGKYSRSSSDGVTVSQFGAVVSEAKKTIKDRENRLCRRHCSRRAVGHVIYVLGGAGADE
jgi:hypothetical protein